MLATDMPERTRLPTYPEPFFGQMGKRHDRQLGDIAGAWKNGLAQAGAR